MRMKFNKKGVISGLLVSVMTISFTVPVFAANEGTVSGTVSSYDIPQSNETENKFQSLTESDPLSIITINNRSFKKYQDLAYMLKYDWFTSGLFGLKLSYEVSDDMKPVFKAENTPQGYQLMVGSVVINMIDMTNGKTIVAKTSDGTYYNPNWIISMNDVTGIDDPFSYINDDIFITSISYSSLFSDGVESIAEDGTYDFDNEILYVTTNHLNKYIYDGISPYLVTTDKIAFTYDVLKNKE